ncbi:MAG: transglycosylase domain-containing protein, partial [Chloroflexi bacterium]|nr:transglycosylase domain-containing protein [Chloroflexota bacterium]
MRSTRRMIRHAYMDQWSPISPRTIGKSVHENRILPILISIVVSMVMGITALLGVAVVATLALYTNYTKDLPSTEKLAKTDLFQSTRIYDRNGDLLFELYDPHDGRRTLVTIDQVPDVVKEATIATEDPTFYTNQGVDVQAIARALYQNVRYKQTTSGASTITQQVVKNYLVGDDPTVDRKIREALTAVEVSRRYSKDEILALYLNSNNYGNLSYGVGAAARGYFNKDVRELDLGEASLLAGLPQSPAVYDPCQNPDAALERQQIVLGLMVKQGFVTDDDSDRAARATTVRMNSPEFARQCGLRTSIKAPHFVNYVRADLEKRFGSETVYRGGLQVYTTFDPKVQAIAEEEARAQIVKLKDQHVTNSAILVMRVDDGEIYAMMGSVDFFDKSIDGQVNITDRLRQPGSSIKPINYVTAFKYGWTPATRILDSKTAFPDATGKPYVPQNYDEREHGMVTVRTALGSSLNIPAVKALYFTSTKDPKAPAPLAMMQTARNMGISTFFTED